MQICVSRMLKESGIFFAVWTCSLYGLLCPIRSYLQLLSVLAIGFAQGLYAVDASDGSTEPPSTVKIYDSWCLNTSWLAHDVTGGQCFGSSFTGVGSFFLLVSDWKDLFIDLLISESLTQGMYFFGDGLHYLNDAKSVARLASFFTTCEPHHLNLCWCFKPPGQMEHCYCHCAPQRPHFPVLVCLFGCKCPHFPL